MLVRMGMLTGVILKVSGMGSLGVVKCLAATSLTLTLAENFLSLSLPLQEMCLSKYIWLKNVLSGA